MKRARIDTTSTYDSGAFASVPQMLSDKEMPSSVILTPMHFPDSIMANIAPVVQDNLYKEFVNLAAYEEWANKDIFQRREELLGTPRSLRLLWVTLQP